MRAVGRSAGRVTKEIGKAALGGLKEGVKGAVKNTAYNTARGYLRNAERGSSPGLSSAGSIGSSTPTIYAPSPIHISTPTPSIKFPASCVCEPKPLSTDAATGETIFMCQACMGPANALNSPIEFNGTPVTARRQFLGGKRVKKTQKKRRSRRRRTLRR